MIFRCALAASASFSSRPSNGAQRAVLKAGGDGRVRADGILIGNVPEHHPIDRRVPGHELARVHHHFTPASDHHHAPSRRQELQVSAQVHVGEHLQNHVHAPAGREANDLVLIAFHPMVEDVVRALTQREIASLVGPAVPMTVIPMARAVWTAAIPTPPLAPWTRSVSPGRARAKCVRARQAVAYGTNTPAPWEKRNLLRKGLHLGQERKSVFRVSSAQGPGHVHAPARFHASDLGPNRFHDSRAVCPGV